MRCRGSGKILDWHPWHHGAMRDTIIFLIRFADNENFSKLKFRPGPYRSSIVSASDHVFGDRASYECDVGYEHLGGSDSMTCGADGEFGDADGVECARRPCLNLPSVVHGHVDESRDYAYGDAATVECVAGYELSDGGLTGSGVRRTEVSKSRKGCRRRFACHSCAVPLRVSSMPQLSVGFGFIRPLPEPACV